MKKILVTGATGYLGSRIVLQLLKENWEVLCIVVDANNLNYLASSTHQVTLLTTDSLLFSEKILEFSPDTVIHCAALYARGNVTLLDLVDANYSFPCRILNTFLKVNHIVHWINTDTSLDPFINTYALTKHQFSQLGKYYHLSGNIKFTNILLEQFYGENDSGTKFIPFLLDKMKNNEPIELTDGMQERDFIYIEDVVSAFLLLVNQAPAELHEFSVGTGVAPPIREIVEYLKEITGSQSSLNFGAIPKRTHEPQCLKADISPIKKLGFSIKYHWQEGLLRTVEESK